MLFNIYLFIYFKNVTYFLHKNNNKISSRKGKTNSPDVTKYIFSSTKGQQWQQISSPSASSLLLAEVGECGKFSHETSAGNTPASELGKAVDQRHLLQKLLPPPHTQFPPTIFHFIAFTIFQFTQKIFFYFSHPSAFT
jgi:hypothetical protein